MVFLHDFGREGQHLERGLGVQRSGVLVQQQELGLVHGSHQQGQCLTLTAGKQAHTGRQAVFQTQIQRLEQFTVLLALCFGNANAQGAGLAAACSQGKVLFDLHGGSSAGHGVLKHAADVSGTLMLAQAGHIHTVNNDLAFVHRPHTGNCVQHGGFACTVAADHGNEIALVQLQVQAVQGSFLVDRASVKGLGNILDLKHFLHPPLPSSPASRSTCPSSTARQGKQPPQKRSAA